MIKNNYLWKEISKSSDYFWNSLFAILYDPLRKDIPIENGRSLKSLTELVYDSKTIIYEYLKCKRPMSLETFIKYTDAIGINTDSLNLEIIKYGNIAYIYLEELFANSKISSTKALRNATIKDITRYYNNLYFEALGNDFENYCQESCEELNQEIIDLFTDLSSNELAYLYQVADVLSCPNRYDATFAFFYIKLNETGKICFKETLQRKSAMHDTVDDEMTELYERLSKISKSDTYTQLSITPEMLTDKLDQISRYSLEYAEELCMYLSMDADAWHTLIDFHKIASALPEDNIPNFPFNEKHALILFLEELYNLPSLKK